MNRFRRIKSLFAAVALVAVIAPGAATAASGEIDIANYGIAMNGMPFAIAIAKGYLKAEGSNVTGIMTDSGGGTTIRNVLAGVVVREAVGDRDPAIHEANLFDIHGKLADVRGEGEVLAWIASRR